MSEVKQDEILKEKVEETKSCCEEFKSVEESQN